MDTQTDNADAANAPPEVEGVVVTAPEPGKPGDSSTHFIFQHKVFAIQNCKFSLNGSDKMPCFYVPFDETQVAAIELRKIQSEFNIPPDSPDAALLKKVEKGLHYVREIRPNDSIPREILDGSASWTVEENHKSLASCKLNQELIFWITGFRGDMPSLETMEREHKGQEARNQLKDAHRKLTQLLHLPETKVVTQRLSDISRETCYIEALRERSSKLGEIVHKLTQFSSAYKKETTFVAEVVRMQDLMRRAAKSIAEKFAKVDNALKDVTRMVNEYQKIIETVRDVRDEVHIELKRWDEYFIQWAETKIERTDEVERMFRAFYRFLAEHYMEQQTWGSSTGAKKK